MQGYCFGSLQVVYFVFLHLNVKSLQLANAREEENVEI